jgi:hypothetical protein
MDEQQVRDLVREALARHLGEGRVGTTGPTPGGGAAAGTSTPGRAGWMGAEAFAKAAPSPANAPVAWKTHLSHGRFVYLAPSEPDSPCIVEPHVRCHHCGFCQSYGH